MYSYKSNVDPSTGLWNNTSHMHLNEDNCSILAGFKLYISPTRAWGGEPTRVENEKVNKQCLLDKGKVKNLRFGKW